MKRTINTLIPATFFTLSLFIFSSSASANDIYKVTRVGQGNSLNLRAYPSSTSRIKVAIPHNASWVVKRNSSKKVGRSVWNKVVWNKEEGWVNSNFLSFDPASTRIAKQRQQCLRNPQGRNKLCCGYPVSERKRPFKHVDILSVRGIATGKTLPLRTQPGQWKGRVAVAIPHNATWVARLGKVKKLSNGQVWEYVRWNGQNGWVNKSHAAFDKGVTQLGDRKRKMCSL